MVMNSARVTPMLAGHQTRRGTHMNRTFALAATLAAGIAMAPMAADAALYNITPLSPGVVLSVPSKGVFSPTSVADAEIPPGSFTDR
jgi:hypothetical protein